jgi:hypothetical protein
MKKLSLLFIMFLSCGVLFAQQPEVVLTDFDGAHFEGVDYVYWSYNYAPDSVDNPVTDGINPTANCVFYPVHWFYSSWGWVPSFQVFKPVPPDVINDSKYFYFELLAIQDTLSVADTIVCKLKFKDGANEEAYSEEVLVPLVAGGANVWQAVAIEIPADMLPTDHTSTELMTSPKGNEVAAYYDNFGFTNTEIGTAIRRTSVQHDIRAFMTGNQLNISLDESSLVRSVEVYDISGARVLQKGMHSMGKDFSMELDVNAGIYIVRINSEKGLYTKKFVKF